MFDQELMLQVINDAKVMCTDHLDANYGYCDGCFLLNEETGRCKAGWQFTKKEVEEVKE